MKKIIVGFSTNEKILAKIIRWFTNSSVSHTYVRIPVPEYNEDMIFQAAFLNVNYCNYKYFKTYSKIVEEYEINVEDATYEYGELIRVTEAGKPYSILTVLGFFWILAMRMFGIKVHNPFKDRQKSYICVELTCHILGLPEEAENLTPEDLRCWCERYGKRIK